MTTLRLKNSLVFGLLVFISLFGVQCQKASLEENILIEKNESSSSGFTKLTGYVRNRDVYPHTKDIMINVSHISGKDRVVQFRSPINDDGTFSFEIDLARPQDVIMHPYLDFLYLLPNDSLHVEIDFKNLSTVQLSGGRSAEINKDFARYFEATAYRTGFPFDYGKVGTDCAMNCSWAEIRAKLDEDRALFYERRQAFLQNNSVCEEVLILTEAMIEMDYYTGLLGIMQKRDFLAKETMDKETMMNEVNEVALKYINADYYSIAHFRFISYAYIGAASFVNPVDKDMDILEWSEKASKTETIRDFMLTVWAGNALLRKDLENFEKFSQHVNDKYLIDRLMQDYRTTRANMLNPEGISSSILRQPGDLSGRMSFDNNFLADQIVSAEGKVQVVNIGARWCAPCKVVLRQTQTLMQEYAGSDVSFSFICLSADDKETRKMYRDLGIDDTSVYFTDNDEYYFLSQTFSPLSFPYGILVNKKGVIVDYGSHVRPELALREKIDLLLEQDHLVK